MEKISDQNLKSLVEAAIFSAEKPLSLVNIKQGVLANFQVTTSRLHDTILALITEYRDRGVELVEVASGFRFQVVKQYHQQIVACQAEKNSKLSSALLETLALIAYEQPITRGEIEQIRGVSVGSHLVKTLLERQWIKTVGEKQVPGRPKLYATTKQFLDYFNLKSLAQLPELQMKSDDTVMQPADDKEGVLIGTQNK